MAFRILLALTLSMVMFAAPAAAAGSAQVPEGSSMTLFALGLAGLIIGRRFAIKSRRNDNEDR